MNNKITYNRHNCLNCPVSKQCLPLVLDTFAAILFDEMITKRYMIKKGRYLLRSGADFKSFFTVRTGSFKTNLVTEDGREQISSFYYSGELMGFDAIESGQYGGNLQALEDSYVCMIDYDKLLKLSSKEPPLQRYIFKLMSQRLTNDNYVRFNSAANERVASFVLNSSGRLLRPGFIDGDFQLAMSRRDIGSFLGLAGETVSRVMTQFQSDKLITCSGKHLVILNHRLLQRISRFIPED